MRIALAFGLCLIAAAAVAGPRAKDLPKLEADVTAATQNVRETFRAMLVDLDLSLVYRFGETFFLRAGPEIGVTLGGRREIDSGGTKSGGGGSVLQVSGVVGFGMNLEL